MKQDSIVSRKSQDPIKKVGQVAEKILDGLTVQAPGGHPWGRKPSNEITKGYIPEIFIRMLFPCQNPKSTVFKREYGDYSLEFGSIRGVPYGKAVRCLMMMITTRYVQQKNDIKDPDLRRVVVLGSVRKAAEYMGYKTVTGGKHGSMTRITETLEQLLPLTIYTTAEKLIGKYKVLAGDNIRLFDKHCVAWNIRSRKESPDIKGGWVRISPEFEQLILRHASPVDIDIYCSLQPRQQDLYAWACRRVWSANLQRRKETLIPYDSILRQFFDNVTDVSKSHQKNELFKGLVEIKTIYPKFDIEPREQGLILRPSPLHIPRKSIGYV
jgi:hypothetical protein